MIKALSAVFRDKLRICIIKASEGKVSKDIEELMKDYEVTNLPRLIVEQTYDSQKDEILKQYKIFEYD